MQVLKEALANAGVEAGDLDHLLMHQANIRIMETVAKKMKIPMDKVYRLRYFIFGCENAFFVARCIFDSCILAAEDASSMQVC